MSTDLLRFATAGSVDDGKSTLIGRLLFESKTLFEDQIAALAAEGTSEIGNIVQIDRGYERIDERLRSLGANIERVEA